MAGFDSSGIVGSRSRLESAIYVPNEAARLALSPSKDGQLVVQIDTNVLYSWDAGSSTYKELAQALTPASVSDTNIIDHTVTSGVLSSDVVYQDSNSVNLSDDASGLKADVVTQNTNSINLSEDASGVKADLNIQDTSSVDLSVNASGLKADVLPAGVDHDGLLNTHNLTTDIDHDSVTNTHNLTTDIDHNSLTNTHDLTTDIDHNSIANTHNLTTDVDHDSITNTHNLTTDIDHNSVASKQGGTTNEYYHLTSAEHDIATQAAGSAQSGYINTSAQNIAGDKTFDNDVVITEDLTVNGTTVTLNTETLDVEDTNITVNKNGNQVSADDSAGITVEMSDATDAKILYDKDTTSRFKVGDSGSEVEVADVSSSQSLTNKTIDADDNTISNLAHGAEVDNPSSGIHGVTGNVVGHTDSQTLTNKTIDADSNTISNIDNNEIKAAAGIVESKLTLDHNTADAIHDNVTGEINAISEKASPVDEDLLLIEDSAASYAKKKVQIGSLATAGGNEIEETESSHGFSVLDAIYHDGSNWVSTSQADDEDTLATHLVKEVVDTNTFKALQFGKIESTSHGYTIGSYYYLSNSSANTATSTEPSTGYSVPLFYVLDANNVLAMMYRPSAIGDGIASDSEIGSVIAFAGTSTPTGFLACEGQAVSRSTYSKLFTAIGTAWGVGDGSTTFNLPDGRSGFLVGAGEGDEFTVNTDRSVGDYNDDQMQQITGKYEDIWAGSTTGEGAISSQGGAIDNRASASGGATFDLMFDSADSPNARTGTETVPNSLAVKFCIRYEPKGALKGSDYYNQTVFLKDVKSNGTDGGTFTSGSWQTRVLNTTENSQTWCSLSSNQFTLSAGKYRIKASAPALLVNHYKLKVRNISDSTDDLIGSSEYASTAYAVATKGLVEGVIEILSSKTFEIQHYCESTRATDGFGRASNFGVDEIYTQVEIERIGD